MRPRNRINRWVILPVALGIFGTAAIISHVDFRSWIETTGTHTGLASTAHAIDGDTRDIHGARIRPAQAQSARPTSKTQIAGVASMIDGDTLELHGERIRLTGIDAPESGQTCQKKDGTEWRCGQYISNKLARLINRRHVRCDIEGRDRYGRHLGTCFYKSTNINAAIVRAGWAMAYRRYSTRYVPEETKAKAHERGIWAGPFIAPWDWRKQR